MEKYEKHNLTRQEDDIIGAFGMHMDALDDPDDELNPFSYPSEWLPVFHSLVDKRLIEPIARTYGTESLRYRLTESGKRLWKQRSKEEEEGLPETY